MIDKVRSFVSHTISHRGSPLGLVALGIVGIMRQNVKAVKVHQPESPVSYLDPHMLLLLPLLTLQQPANVLL